MTETTAGFGEVLPTLGEAKRIGRYVILAEIARGGMGVVYRARHQDLPREVALKVILARAGATPKQRKRFLREAKSLSRLKHPNLVQIYDVGEDAHQLYMVLDLIRGKSLQEHLDRQGPFGVEEALRIVGAVARAVEHAHQSGVLHRDLKPENVLLESDGTPRLTDFGLTKELDAALDQTRITLQGQFLGTPGYWAPEQARGELHAMGPATDVYGLGATLYALLTRQPPAGGESLVEVMASLSKPATAPSSLNPDVPNWLDHVVLRALALEPGDRFGSAAEFAEALDRPDSPTVSRPLALVALGALVVLGLVTWVGAFVGAERPLLGASPVASASEARPADPDASLRALTEASFERGVALWEAGHPEEAGLAFEDVLRFEPSSADDYVRRGRALSYLGNYQDEIGAYNDAIRLQPDHLRAYFERSGAKFMLGDDQGRIEDLEQILRLDPNHLDARENLAAAFMQRGDDHARAGNYQQAVRAFDEGIRVSPPQGSFYQVRGAAKAELGDLEGAIEDFEQTIQLKPDEKWVRFARRGLEDARQRLAAQTAQAIYEQGFADFQAGRYRQAIEGCTEAIRLVPDYADAYVTRSGAYGNLNEHQAAIEDATKAIQLDPGRGDAYCNRAAARVRLGDYPGTIEDCTEAIRLQPDSADAYGLRGVARNRLGDHEGAIEDHDEVIWLQPDSALGYANRGVASGELGDWVGAESDAGQAIRLDPDYAEAYSNHALSLAELGDYEAAIEAWKRALELKPSASWAPQARESIELVRQRLAEQEGSD